MVSDDELFIKEFPDNMPIMEVINKFESMEESIIKQKIRLRYCDLLITLFSKNYIEYDLSSDLINHPYIISLCKNIKQFDKKSYFYWSFYYFLKQDYQKCKENIHLLLNSNNYSEQPFGEADLADLFLIPFKNAFDGFWEFVADELRHIETELGIPELCKVVGKYYNASTNNEILDLLQKYIQLYPNFNIPNELLGYTYYSIAMWNNSVAYLERLKTPYFFYLDEIYWMQAYSYGKIKNYTDEEKYYRKCYEIYPSREFLLNNLGYCLFRQKKYSEAKRIFEECISKNIDFPYSVNNYVRLLIATGRYVDAKKFVKESTFRISKSLKEKVSKLPYTNARLKKDTSLMVDVQEKESGESVAVNIGVKRQQFSNEKILEDELTAKIEAEIPVFGQKLKIYKRHGEYGRQYIIPIGRLDLLCEDSEGNLYIIELKKDSGYDDAYKQTAAYLDWFEANNFANGKKVYGIICLNSPTKELIEKVHNDKRMKLFEYQISYIEH